MIRPRRKNRVFEYSTGHNGPVVFLLIALFCSGLLVSLRSGVDAVLIYLLLWAVSYVVIFAGTCRYCAYYGKRCPIPLEGSCVTVLFAKKKESFGWRQLFWATVAYAFRVLVPFWIILQERLVVWGSVYISILMLFWFVHLRITGCPNCINTACPLNPGGVGES